jgi:hypothetical protein
VLRFCEIFYTAALRDIKKLIRMAGEVISQVSPAVHQLIAVIKHCMQRLRASVYGGEVSEVTHNLYLFAMVQWVLQVDAIHYSY